MKKVLFFVVIFVLICGYSYAQTNEQRLIGTWNVVYGHLLRSERVTFNSNGTATMFLGDQSANVGLFLTDTMIGFVLGRDDDLDLFYNYSISSDGRTLILQLHLGAYGRPQYAVLTKM